MNNFKSVLSALMVAERTGKKDLVNGVILLGATPQIAAEAYLHVVFPGLKENDIKSIEDRLGTQIPNQYRDFLSDSNGLILFNANLVLFGLRRNATRIGEDAYQPFSIETSNTIERPNDALPNWIIIGSYRQDGSRLYIDKLNGMVYRCDRNKSSSQFNVWPDFWSMLASEIDRISGLYNMNNELVKPMDILPRDVNDA